MTKVAHQVSFNNDRNKAGSNIWSTLLNDISSTSTKSVFSAEKSIIIVGDDLSGKSVLATKLQGSDDPHRGSALDFQVIEVQDDDIDESGICRMWIVDGNLSYRSLLQFALPKSMLSDSLIILTVDMSQPWNIPETLDKWTRVLYEHVNSLKLEISEMESLKQKLTDDFLNYVDPSEMKDESKLVLTKGLDESCKSEVRQLDDLALSGNLGVPIIVVCTKCDYLETLESEYDYKEEHFDFVQHYLRLYCLKHGAGLVFTSMKENKNIEVLKKYVLHKLYGFPFDGSASVVDRDGLFVPVGWDSEKKIGILKENFTKFSVTDSFNSVINRPAASRLLSYDMKELTVEDEQAFLSKAQVVLSKAPVTSRPGSDAATPRSKIRLSQDGRPNFSAVPSAIKTGKVDPTKAGANNERMLANFFNSLLNKKPGSPSGGGMKPGKQGSGSKPKLDSSGNGESQNA